MKFKIGPATLAEDSQTVLAISHIAATLRSLGCEYDIVFKNHHYSSSKKQSSPKFKWEDEIFGAMRRAECGDQVRFTIDKEWDYRKVQSFRTAVRNHAIEFWGAGNFITTYDKESGVVTAVRSETRS